MATLLDVFNSALSKASSATLKQADETTPEGIACNALWPSIYGAHLEVAAWPSAILRASLTRETTAPEGYGSDGDYKHFFPLTGAPFAMPGKELIRILGIVSPDDPKWDEEGDYLLTNYDAPTIILKYVGLVPITQIRSRTLISALESALATELASKFLRNENMAARLNIEYSAMLNTAMASVTKFVDLPGMSLDTVVATSER